VVSFGRELLHVPRDLANRLLEPLDARGELLDRVA
jgi:hypothetical protein